MSLESIEQALGWQFSAKDLLKQALTHATYAQEPSEPSVNYERLEFLGDAVLDLLATCLLFERFPLAKEGELSKRRAQLVCKETLYLLASEINLRESILVQDNLLISKNILADCYEALIGAVYLDGGYNAVEKCFSAKLLAFIEPEPVVSDFKTHLQERAHMLYKAVPHYKVVQIEGPAHARIFTCEVEIQGEVLGRGVGPSKKLAEQLSARMALEKINRS